MINWVGPLALVATAALSLSGCAGTPEESESSVPATSTAASPSVQESSPSASAEPDDQGEASAEATDAESSEESSATPAPSERDVDDADSELSLDTLPEELAGLKRYENEITGFVYSPSGDASTPGIYLISAGDPRNYDDLVAGLGDAAEQLDEASMCDTSSSEPSCYFKTDEETFFVGGEAGVELETVQGFLTELRSLL